MTKDSGRVTGSREPSPSSTGLGPSGFDPARWITLECERVLYVDRGHDTMLCDRLPSPVTLVVKLAA